MLEKLKKEGVDIDSVFQRRLEDILEKGLSKTIYERIESVYEKKGKPVSFCEIIAGDEISAPEDCLKTVVKHLMADKHIREYLGEYLEAFRALMAPFIERKLNLETILLFLLSFSPNELRDIYSSSIYWALARVPFRRDIKFKIKLGRRRLESDVLGYYVLLESYARTVENIRRERRKERNSMLPNLYNIPKYLLHEKLYTLHSNIIKRAPQMLFIEELSQLLFTNKVNKYLDTKVLNCFLQKLSRSQEILVFLYSRSLNRRMLPRLNPFSKNGGKGGSIEIRYFIQGPLSHILSAYIPTKYGECYKGYGSQIMNINVYGVNVHLEIILKKI
ncbi:hypothetical protein P8X24_09280 [Pyrococcus kukulkanii]|uniref:hypothetical protein n=1 Tax=Pyrococcus kukulkanii TaxID=1609559 RepID=UPI003564E89A